MIKPSILLSLFLGIIFAQVIPAHSTYPEKVDKASGADSSDEEQNSDEDESAEESEEEDGPALTCLLLGNLGCNAKCTIIATAFAIKSSGECTTEFDCQCTLEQDDSLEGLLRAKFIGKGAGAALKKIKEDEKLTNDVLDILREPFQTAEQIKKRIKEVNPDISNLLTTTKRTPAYTRNLVERNESLNLKNIRDYVTEKLKPILKSSANQLEFIDYESLKSSLDGMTDKDMQSIVSQVRRTKNNKLSEVVDTYLKSKNVKEIPSEKENTLADTMEYLIIDTVVNEVEKKKLAAEKQTRKSSPAKVKGKKEPMNEERETTKDNSQNEIVSPSARFVLQGFDRNSIKKYAGRIDKIFKGPGYTLLFQKSPRGLHFTWIKGSDMVDMSVPSEGGISQSWRLGNVLILLNRSSDGSLSDVWDFRHTIHLYSKSVGGQVSSQWLNGEKDMKTLQKYRALINEWCSDNDFLLENQLDCAIYHRVIAP